MVTADLANMERAGTDGCAAGEERVELEQAADRVVLGLEKKSRLRSPEEKERIAVQEEGDAMAGQSGETCDRFIASPSFPRPIGARWLYAAVIAQRHYDEATGTRAPGGRAIKRASAVEEIRYVVM